MKEQHRTFRANIATPKVIACIASAMVAFALSRGITMNEIEQATGLSGLEFIDPDARIPDNVVGNIWQVITRKFPNQFLSLELAKAAPFSSFGGLAHGMQYACNLEKALKLFVNNRLLLADRLSMTLKEKENEVILSVSHPQDVLDEGRTGEVGMALLSRLVVEILNIEGSLKRVEFKHMEHGPLEEYRSFFLTPVLFQQPENALVFHRKSLSTPVTQANIQLFSYVEQHFELVRKRILRGGYPGELSKLFAAISENATIGEFGVASAAARANLSVRAAQRLSAAHGTSVKALIDKARISLANEILSDTHASIETVSTLVGYSDERAFRRAYERLTGLTPAKFRQSVLSKKS